KKSQGFRTEIFTEQQEPEHLRLDHPGPALARFVRQQLVFYDAGPMDDRAYARMTEVYAIQQALHGILVYYIHGVVFDSGPAFPEVTQVVTHLPCSEHGFDLPPDIGGAHPQPLFARFVYEMPAQGLVDFQIFQLYRLFILQVAPARNYQRIARQGKFPE